MPVLPQRPPVSLRHFLAGNSPVPACRETDANGISTLCMPMIDASDPVLPISLPLDREPSPHLPSTHGPAPTGDRPATCETVGQHAAGTGLMYAEFAVIVVLALAQMAWHLIDWAIS